MTRTGGQTKGSAAAHPNSILGRAEIEGDRALMRFINRKRREADIDLQLLNKHHRSGDVSGSAGLGPIDSDGDEE